MRKRRNSRSAGPVIRSIRLLAILAMSALTVACDSDTSGGGAGSTEPEAIRAEVVRVVDGDTVIVLVGGEEERLRYIGIDAPESVQPNRPVECFGPEASDANAGLVAGETVYLVRDVSDRDDFGRLLRYVYVGGDEDDGTFVNLELVRNGFAESVSYPPNVTRQGELDEAERAAREEALGMWGACE